MLTDLIVKNSYVAICQGCLVNCALIFTQACTGNLTSMLTVQQLEPAVADVDALYKAMPWLAIYCKGSFVLTYLKEILHFHPNHIQQCNFLEDSAESLRSKAIASAFLEVSFAKIFLRQYCKDFVSVDLDQHRKLEDSGFPRGSPLLPSVNEAMLKVTESGKLRDLEKTILAS